ncbi:hypothetical protein D5086_001519 [Populus alba]|uniref:Uncharacterized protein n=1 Tax=Populus alba TaxID=43335 RepID=A0ACC4CZH3_POPAL
MKYLACMSEFGTLFLRILFALVLLKPSDTLSLLLGDAFFSFTLNPMIPYQAARSLDTFPFSGIVAQSRHNHAAYSLEDNKLCKKVLGYYSELQCLGTPIPLVLVNSTVYFWNYQVWREDLGSHVLNYQANIRNFHSAASLKEPRSQHPPTGQ